MPSSAVKQPVVQIPVQTRGKIAPEVQHVLEAFASHINTIYGKLEGTKQEFLTKEDAERRYSPEVMSKELQAGGRAPLNLSQLIGSAAQLQPAGANMVSKFASLPPANTQQTQNGQVHVETTTYTPFVFDATTSPGSYKSLKIGVTGIGAGANANLQAPAKGGGDGPATLTVVAWEKCLDSSGVVFWKPLCQ